MNSNESCLYATPAMTERAFECFTFENFHSGQHVRFYSYVLGRTCAREKAKHMNSCLPAVLLF